VTPPTLPPEHLEYLGRPFAFRCSAEVFPPEEVAALSGQGNLLAALASGAVLPATPEQAHFLAFDRDEAEPTTVCERAWVRLKGRREYERERRSAQPPPERKDYGMPEWDQDRCWW